MDDFADVEILCGANVIAATGLKFFGRIYAVITSDIRPSLHMQVQVDRRHVYTGILGNYETMLFKESQNDYESVELYPFGDLPGHKGLGVFQRYHTEDEARDGHQVFVTRVKRELRKRAKSLI